MDSETEWRHSQSTLDTAPRWSGFVKRCRPPRSPNSAKPKCPSAGPRFRSKTRTLPWPTFVWHRSTGCIPMRAEVFGWLCPPNNCSTTRTVLRDPLRPLRLLRLLRRLRPLRPLDPLHLLVQDRLAPPSDPADLADPPPNWRSSKSFYSLNIPNTLMTTMTPFGFGLFEYYCNIFMRYKKCTVLTITYC